MTTKFVSTADRSLHSCPNLTRSPKMLAPDSLSFASKATGSRVSVRSPIWPRRARGPARISAFYAPPSETAETLYEVLGIPEGVSAGGPEIKKAYKKMARKYHPDVSPPGRADEYTRRFIMVHEAYETLSNPQARASYDRDLAEGFLGKPRQYHQESEEKVEWKSRWETQLDELKRRRGNRVSWGSRMRSQT